MSNRNKSNLPSIPPGAKPPSNLPARKTVRALQRATSRIDQLANQLLPYDVNHQAAPEQVARPTILIGIALMAFLFGIVGLWAAIVPLASGAVAPGRVMSDSNRKTIQHLEGGIVKEILVREGDSVKEGQILVRLDNTNAEARNDLVRGQYLASKAMEARLIAERDGTDDIAFPPEFLRDEATDPKLHEILDTQRRLFAARHAAVSGQIDVLNQKIAQSNEEINGLQEQAHAANTQIDLLSQEITVVQGLLKKGNALKPRLLSLQREQAQLLGQRGQAQAMISRAKQTINEAKIAILNQKNDFLNKVVTELKETQVQVSGLEEQGKAAGDVARRIDIQAPIAGTITGLMTHTIGGVVKPGDTITSLVPINDKLVVEARVNPTDIDVVHPGLKAQVRLTAFHMRYLRPVDGTVVTVSPDRFDDQRTGEGFYTARIEIPQSELTDIGNITLTPGMPAETLIVTGSRTMLSYLVGPIRDSFGHAFHEQ